MKVQSTAMREAKPPSLADALGKMFLRSSVQVLFESRDHRANPVVVQFTTEMIPRLDWEESNISTNI